MKCVADEWGSYTDGVERARKWNSLQQICIQSTGPERNVAFRECSLMLKPFRGEARWPGSQRHICSDCRFLVSGQYGETKLASDPL